jgi:hypothetical protein
MSDNTLIPMGMINDTTIYARRSDGFIDMTSMCKAGGKVTSDATNSKWFKEFVNEQAETTGVRPSDLVYRPKKRSERTFVHPQVALRVATWLGPKFAVPIFKALNIKDAMDVTIEQPQTLPVLRSQAFNESLEQLLKVSVVGASNSIEMNRKLDVLISKTTEPEFPRKIFQGQEVSDRLNDPRGLSVEDLHGYVNYFADWMYARRGVPQRHSYNAAYRSYQKATGYNVRKERDKYTPKPSLVSVVEQDGRLLELATLIFDTWGDGQTGISFELAYSRMRSRRKGRKSKKTADAVATSKLTSEAQKALETHGNKPAYASEQFKTDAKQLGEDVFSNMQAGIAAAVVQTQDNAAWAAAQGKKS